MKFLTALLLVLFCSVSLLQAQEPAVPNLLGKEVSVKVGWHSWHSSNYTKADANVLFKDNTVVLILADYSKLEKKQLHGQQVIKLVELEVGKTYQFSFTTESDVEGDLSVNYILHKPPYTTYARKTVKLKKTDQLEAKKQKHVIKFTPKPVKDVYDTPRSLRFFSGLLDGGQVTISDLVLIEVPQESDE